MTGKKKILFFINVDWFFYSHFLDRALVAQKAGYDVVVLTQVIKHKSLIESMGLRVISLSLSRRSINPFNALITLLNIVKVFRNERPDLVHQITLKPIILGSLAARITNIKYVINAIVGGGYIFTSSSFITKLIRPFVSVTLQHLLNPPHSLVVFENNDDLNFFVNNGQVRLQNAILIKGSGVNEDLYYRKSTNNDFPIVILPARLLWDKGIGEFVKAAQLLKTRGINARFALVGGVDQENRSSINHKTLEDWKQDGIVELWGYQNDMPRILSGIDIVCLPSYREGLPKALLEAMAAFLPCVTTDVPGCREAVQDGVNGLIVPPRNSEELATALEKLILDPILRKKFGSKGRERILSEFSSRIICRETLNAYQKLLGS